MHARSPISAASDAHELGQLVVRWYGQADDAASPSEALDQVDMLLATNSFGVADLVGRG